MKKTESLTDFFNPARVKRTKSREEQALPTIQEEKIKAVDTKADAKTIEDQKQRIASMLFSC